MTQEGKPTAPAAEPKGVSRPRVECYATQLSVAKSKSGALGDTCTIVVESGDLEIYVHFPLGFADRIGKELSSLKSGIKVVDAGSMPGGGVDLSKLRNGDGPKR